MLRSRATDAVNNLSTVVLPSACRLCGHLLTELTRVPICSACWHRLDEGNNPPLAVDSQSFLPHTCVCCGEHFLSQWPADTLQHRCRACRMVRPPFAQAVAFGEYAGSLRELLHLLKYEPMAPISERLAPMLAKRVVAMPDLPKNLVIVPVPMHSKHRRSRGIDHADSLAQALTKSLRRQQRGRGMLFEHCNKALVRHRATELQAGLSFHERRTNLRGAFSVRQGRVAKRISGHDVLLVDDIYTTGATARAASLALLGAGALSVRVATMGRAQKTEWRLRGEMRVEGEFGGQEQVWEAQAKAAEQQELPMEQDVAFWTSQNTSVGAKDRA